MRLSKFNEIIKCGDVLHPLDCENEKFVEWISYEIPDECKECKILPICMGGVWYYGEKKKRHVRL